MTRAEQKELKLKKEQEFLKSIKGKPISGKIKDLFRRTTVWTSFRKYMKDKYKVDYLTGRKLTRTWNLHHRNFRPTEYTNLKEESFRCLNNQQHDVLHVLISETIKDPDYLNRLCKEVLDTIAFNEGRDVRDWSKICKIYIEETTK